MTGSEILDQKFKNYHQKIQREKLMGGMIDYFQDISTSCMRKLQKTGYLCIFAQVRTLGVNKKVSKFCCEIW